MGVKEPRAARKVSFLYPGLLVGFVVFLSSCAGGPKSPAVVAPAYVLGNHALYLRLDVAESRGLVVETVRGLLGADNAGDTKAGVAKVKLVYAGVGLSGADFLITGDFNPAQNRLFVFTPKNGWKRISVKGRRGEYSVYQQGNVPFFVYADVAGFLLCSEEIGPLLDRFFDGGPAAADVPVWLSAPPGRKDGEEAFSPLQVYVPVLGNVMNNSSSEVLTGGAVANAAVALKGEPVLLDGHWGYRAWAEVDLGNAALKNAAAAVLSMILSPLGAGAKPGEGSRLVIENLVVSQEKIQEALVGFLKRQ